MKVLDFFIKLIKEESQASLESELTGEEIQHIKGYLETCYYKRVEEKVAKITNLEI